MQLSTVARRDHSRSRAFLWAEVDSGYGPAESRIRDISRTGALIQSETSHPLGALVRLVCGNTKLDARVAWTDTGCFGLEFDSPLLVDELADCSGFTLNLSPPRSYRLSDLA